MKSKLFAIFVAASVFVAACGGGSDEPAGETPAEPTAAVVQPTSAPPAAPVAAQVDPAVAQAILATIDANLAAAQAEDVAAFMATIHPESPLYQATETQMAQIFADYDLSYEVNDVVIVSATESEARVAFVQTTRKVGGPDFRDNRLSGEHVLRNLNGVWLIYDSIPMNIDYLD